VVAIGVVLAAAGCGATQPTDDLETSDQLVSVSPTTVVPTPANASPDPGSLVAWCERLVEADDARVEEVYRQGFQLDNQRVASAVTLLLAGDGTDRQLVRAGHVVERSCAAVGVRPDP
jgi:hypothetical protein